VTVTKAKDGLLGTLALASLSPQKLLEVLAPRVWQRHGADRRTGVTAAQVKKVLRESGLPINLRPSEDDLFEWALHDLCEVVKAHAATIKTAAGDENDWKKAYNQEEPKIHKAARTAVYVYLRDGKLPIL